MGLFKRAKSALGGVDHDLIETGALARGNVLDVDPDDPQNIALDLEHDVPPAPIVLVGDDGSRQTVETTKAAYTYEELIRGGRPCTVEVAAVFPLNQLTRAGLPASGLMLEVHRDGVAPYGAQVGLHIPDCAVPVVVPGARLPGKWLPGPGLPTDVDLVTIDFPALQA